jgi:SPP1 family predicted phage head-tail adaptor
MDKTKINPGRLNCLITIQNERITQDAELNAVHSWVNWKSLWAEKLSQTSREFYRLSNQNAEVSAVFRVQYVEGITAHQRIVYKSTNYEIVGIPDNEDERNRSLLIAAKGVS